jgi:TetR/AcrR family transcriptional repressor of nem operon
MVARSNSSRERILEKAESIILQKGFAGTSIDHIREQANITKGGFFYHFRDKNELAKALVARYLLADELVFNGLLEQADNLSEDPLHRVLIFLKLFSETMANMESNHPGCLVASFTYESYQFDDEIRDSIKSGVLIWRQMILERLTEVVEVYPPHVDVDLTSLADMFTAIVEGGIILSRIFKDNTPLVNQVLAYRSHLRFIFGDLA